MMKNKKESLIKQRRARIGCLSSLDYLRGIKTINKKKDTRYRGKFSTEQLHKIKLME